MKIKQRAIGNLSNNMRRYAEANLGFATLKHVDLEEAIDNLDRAFESKLEAFHTLYDVDKDDFEYFDHPDTALLILLRNALHHRDHDLFLSWNADMAQGGGPQRYLGAEFLLARHDVVGVPSVARQLYKAQDFLLRVDLALSSPAVERRMGDRNRERMLRQLKVDLHFDDLFLKAAAERYPPNQVYINVIPIFISATCRVFRSLKQRGVRFDGYDAAAYEQPFTNELRVNLSNLVYNKVRIL